MDLNKKRTFCCPVDEDIYFIPKCDDKRDDSPKFPSPTGCLTREETEKLEKCNDEANELLLSLGLSGELGIDRSYFLALQDNEGAEIHVNLQCEKVKVQMGKLIFVGLNFLIMDNKTGVRIIPYQHILKIDVQKKSKAQDQISHDSFDELVRDPLLRRDLVLSFGATVSQSPVLINEFFGLTLSVLLLTYINHEVTIFTESDTVTGVITKVDSETINLSCKKSREVIPLANICKINTRI